MAVIFSDDFTGTDGAAWDTTKWPVQRDPGGGAGISNINANRGHMASGGRSLAMTQVTGTDFEIVVKGAWNTLSNKYPEIGYRCGNGIGAASPTTGYTLQMGPDSGGRAQLFNASYGSITNVIDTALSSSTASFWFKVRIIGTNHKIKWWPTSGSEPGTWQIDLTDTQFDGGRFMLANWNNDDVYWDDYTVTDLSGITTPMAAGWKEGVVGGYGRTATALASSDVTMCGWFYRTANTSTSNFFGTDDDSSNYWQPFIGGGSDQIVVARNSGGDFYSGLSITNNTWYHFAASYVTATGVTTVRLMPLGGSASTASSGSGNGPGNWTLQLGHAYGSGVVGRIANFKVWTAALTGTEIDAEAPYYRAQRTSNLWGEYNFFNGVNTLQLQDLSGNARHLDARSAGGSNLPFTMAGPPGILENVSTGPPPPVMFLAPVRSTVTLT